MKPNLPFLAACILLSASCVGNPDHSHPKHVETVQMKMNQILPDVEVEVVTGIHVILPGPAEGSGLVWEIAADNSRVLEQTSGLKIVPGANGRGPTTEVTFYTLKPGRSRIRFFLVKPNQAETAPIGACETTISVSD
jgi:hypothetical protein